MLINIHTDPDEAEKEIPALKQTALNAQTETGEQDIIILGDFNADCTYFDENTLVTAFPAPDYTGIISNTEDTTVKSTTCTYDRIIITQTAEEEIEITSWRIGS